MPAGGEREGQVGLVDIALPQVLVDLVKARGIVVKSPPRVQVRQPGGRGPRGGHGAIQGCVEDPHQDQRRRAVPGHVVQQLGVQRKSRLVGDETRAPFARRARLVDAAQRGQHVFGPVRADQRLRGIETQFPTGKVIAQQDKGGLTRGAGGLFLSRGHRAK